MTKILLKKILFGWRFGKSLEKIKLKGIGLKNDFFTKNVAHIGIGANGINKTIQPIYKALGYQTNNLNHYYSVNKNLKPKLISSPENYNHPSLNPQGLAWTLLNENDIENFKKEFPYKIFSNSNNKKTPFFFK